MSEKDQFGNKTDIAQAIIDDQKISPFSFDRIDEIGGSVAGEIAGVLDDDLRRESLLSDFDLNKNLYDFRDQRTGLRTKAVLLSDQGCVQLGESIKGSKLFFFIDFNHMGPTNDFDFKLECDHILEIIKPLAEMNFSKMPFELFRLGGDEIGGIIPNTPESISALEDFLTAMEEVRRREFADKSVEEVRKFATMRSIARSARQEYRNYLPSFEDFTLEGFEKYLAASLAEIGLEYPQEALIGLHPEERTGFLQAIYAQQGEKMFADVDIDKEQIMGMSIALIDAGEALKPELMKRLIGQGDKYIHDQKRGSLNSTLEVLTLNPKTHLKHNDSYELAGWRERESRYNDLRNGLHNSDLNKDTRLANLRELHYLSVMDPSINGLIRKDMAMDTTAEKILRVYEETEFIFFDVDIVGFGAYNNMLGYQRADEILRDVMENVLAIGKFKGAYIVRRGGGDFSLIMPLGQQKQISDHLLDEYKRNIINTLDKVVNMNLNNEPYKDAVLAELSEKRGLSQYLPITKIKNNYFENDQVERINVQWSKKKIKPEDDFSTIFSN